MRRRISHFKKLTWVFLFFLVAGLPVAAQEPLPEARAPSLSPGGTKRNYPGSWSAQGWPGEEAGRFNHIGYGPLDLESQSPLQSLRLGIRPRTPSSLRKGQTDLHGSATWVNVWSRNQNYLLDYEMLQSFVALSYGVADSVLLSLELQDRSRFGGEMDGTVQGFHNFFNIDQNGRDDSPKNQFVLQLDPPNGEPEVTLGPEDRGSFTRNVQVTMQQSLAFERRALPAVSYSVTARVETSDHGDLEGGHNLDLAASVSLSRRFHKLFFYGTLGYAKFGHDKFRGISLADDQFSSLVALEWRAFTHHSFLIQILRSEGLLVDFSPFDDDSNELGLGWKWEMYPGTMLEIGVVENILNFENSADFGMLVGFSKRF